MRAKTKKCFSQLVPLWGPLAGVVWLTAVAVAAYTMASGVRTEHVELVLADGTAIQATLYLPAELGQRVPGVVVLHGSAVGRRSCAPGLSVPLARNGFVALAIDFRGHGDSGGRLPREQFEDVESLLGTRADHPEVEAAIGFLKAHPAVDGDRIGLVGHSRGGWAAVNVGFERGDVRSVVSIGVAPRTADVYRPHNLMILSGGKDSLSPGGEARRSIAAATGGAVHEDDVPFGSLLAGSARRWSVVNRVNHFTQLADHSVTRRAVQWVSGSLNIEAGPVEGTDLLIVTWAVLAATLSGVAVATWVLMLLSGAKDEVVAPPARTGVTLIACGVLAISGMVAAPMVAWLTAGRSIGPVAFLMPSLALVAWLADVSLLAGLIHKPVGPNRLDGVRSGVVLGVLALLLSFIWLGVPWATTWADLTPTPRRLLLGLVLMLLLSPFSLLLAWGWERAVSGSRSIVPGLGWLVLAVGLWLGHELWVVEERPLFTIPVFFVAASFLVPLPLWLLPSRPGMTVARAVCHAGGLAWLLACHLPLVE